MTLLNTEGTAGGGGVVTGLGAALHGSSPSYVELDNGLFSSTKLFPRVFPYRTPVPAGRGALNIAERRKKLSLTYLESAVASDAPLVVGS